MADWAILVPLALMVVLMVAFLALESGSRRAELAVGWFGVLLVVLMFGSLAWVALDWMWPALAGLAR